MLFVPSHHFINTVYLTQPCFLFVKQGKALVGAVKLSCKVCGKDRNSEEEMARHMRKHRQGDNFVCDICGFTSIQLKKIIQHRCVSQPPLI